MNYQVLKCAAQEIRDNCLRQKFTPCVYNWKNRSFEETRVSDMEFIKHLSTGIILDLRNLAQIKKYEDFVAMCHYLEGCKPETLVTLDKITV